MARSSGLAGTFSRLRTRATARALPTAPNHPSTDETSTTDRCRTDVALAAHRPRTDTAPASHPCATGRRRPIQKDLGSYRPPREHAACLLEWLQSKDGRTAWIDANELTAAYREMCFELGLDAHGWAPVGAALRRLIGGKKHYRSRGGRRRRVWWIPPKGHPVAAIVGATRPDT